MMTIATLDLRSYASTTHRSTTYFVQARAFLPDCGSLKDQITTSEKLGGKGRGGGCCAQYSLRSAETDEDENGMTFGQV